jgi:hypothetical protein
MALYLYSPSVFLAMDSSRVVFSLKLLAGIPSFRLRSLLCYQTLLRNVFVVSPLVFEKVYEAANDPRVPRRGLHAWVEAHAIQK